MAVNYFRLIALDLWSVAIIATLHSTAPALAQTTQAPPAAIVTKDANGLTRVESLGPERYGSFIRRDAWGSYQGTATVTPYGDVILRDSRGRVEGTAPAPTGTRKP